MYSANVEGEEHEHGCQYTYTEIETMDQSKFTAKSVVYKVPSNS